MDKIIAFVIQLAFIALLVILGIVFSKRKGSFLIAGYNTGGAEEKKKYDEKALCRFMGKLMFILAGCYAVIMFATVLDRTEFIWGGIVLILVICVWAVIYANTGNRFRKRK